MKAEMLKEQAELQLKERQREYVLTRIRRSIQEVARCEQEYKRALETHKDLLSQEIDDIIPIEHLKIEGGERY